MFWPFSSISEKCCFPVSQSHSACMVQMVASVNFVAPQPYLAWLCQGISLNSSVLCVVCDLPLTAQQSSSFNKQNGLINLR